MLLSRSLSGNPRAVPSDRRVFGKKPAAGDSPISTGAIQNETGKNLNEFDGLHDNCGRGSLQQLSLCSRNLPIVLCIGETSCQGRDSRLAGTGRTWALQVGTTARSNWVIPACVAHQQTQSDSNETAEINENTTLSWRIFNMLVLGRKVGERILIDGGITVCVVKIKGDGSVQLGIEAPGTTRIFREEVFQRINATTEVTHG
jgi:carbon storage regulator